MTGPGEPIAIVGMAGRFPGADSVADLWRLLCAGTDAVRAAPPEGRDIAPASGGDVRVPTAGGFLDDVAGFDATLFGISPREAADIDPQQRLFLETAWRALEDANTPADRLRGTRTGVYAGASWHDYATLRSRTAVPPTPHSVVGSALDMIATRVSYTLEITGPSMTVETGCSSASVAVDLAVRALRSGDIEAALVGGVNLILGPEVTAGLAHFGALSPDGRCAAFGAGANGFVRGEGVAVLYLKTLSAARRDGDPIRATIVATAVNNDGGGESLVTPSLAGQRDLLRRAYLHTGLDPARLGYLEAHGTGTGRGDPVEAGALGAILGRRRPPDAGPLPIGSIKSAIGHLEAAAGIAGLVKAVLCLEHRHLPATLHADTLRPDIDFDTLGVRVMRVPAALPVGPGTLVGVNSFGWGGTNVHIVLGPAPEPTAVPAAPVPRSGRAGTTVADGSPGVDGVSRAPGSRTTPEPGDVPGAHGASAGAEAFGPRNVPGSGGAPETSGVLMVSAQDGATLRERCGALADLLTSDATTIDEMGAALAAFAPALPWRAAFLVGDHAEAAPALGAFRDGGPDSPTVLSGRARPVGRVAFVFPGQGSQWHSPASGLYGREPTFTEVVDDCAAALAPHVDWDAHAVLTGAAGPGWLARVDQVQPVLWAYSLALAAQWRAMGVHPDVVIGHSQGEIAAATLAGLLDVRSAARIVARRSAALRTVAGTGRMLAVDLPADEIPDAIAGFESSVGLAVHNGPRSCVLSGDTDAVDALAEILTADGVYCRPVNVDYASHSPHMDRLAAALRAELADIGSAAESGRSPSGGIEMMSTVTVRPLTALDPGYWVDNLRRPVRFAEAMTAVFDAGVTHVIEVAPHPVLTPAVEQLAATRLDPPVVLSSLTRDRAPLRELARGRALAFLAGLRPVADIAPPDRNPLPHTAMRRSRYWLPPGAPTEPAPVPPVLRPSPADPAVQQATVTLTRHDLDWLGDHRVGEAVIAPAVFFLTLAAHTGPDPTTPRRLRDIRFLNPLPLDVAATASLAQCVDVLRRPGLAGTGVLEFRTSTTGPDSGTLHAHGTAVPVTDPVGEKSARATPVADDSPPRATVDPNDSPVRATPESGGPPTRAPSPAPPPCRSESDRTGVGGHRTGAPSDPARVTTDIDPADFYRRCERRGLHYGPEFRGIRELRVTTAPTGRSALARIEVGPLARARAAAGELHVTLLDAAAQTALALFDPSIRADPRTEPPAHADLPVVGESTVLVTSAGPVTPTGATVPAGQSAGSAAPTGADGLAGPIGSDGRAGLIGSAVSIGSGVPTSTPEPTLVPAALAEYRTYPAPAGFVDRAWAHAVRTGPYRADIHLRDDEGRLLAQLLGLELAEIDTTVADPRRRDREFHVGFVPETRRPSESGSRSDNDLFVLTGDEPGCALLGVELRRLGVRVGHEIVPGQPTTVVFLAPAGEGIAVLDPARDGGQHRRFGSGGAGLTDQRQRLADLADSVRASSGVEAPLRLVVVTTGAQAATPDERPDPGAALYWGFGRVLRREHPELAAVLLDLDPAAAVTDRFAACAAELAVAGAEDQVLLRAGNRLVGRITRGVPAQRVRAPWRGARRPFRLGAGPNRRIDEIEFRPLAPRAPEAGEVRLRVEASAINFIDLMKVTGSYPDDSQGADLLGVDCAGVIEAVGPEVRDRVPGQRVVACAFGALASHLTVRADHTAPIPAGMASATAAALPLVVATAWQAFARVARVEPGETVLIHSAAGGVGAAAVAITRHLGGRVLATAGSERRRAYLRALGITDVFDSRAADWPEQVRSATGGRGVDVVLNSLAGAAVEYGIDVLAEDGRFVEIGKRDIYADRRIGLRAFAKGLTLAAVDLGGMMTRRPHRYAALLGEAWQSVLDGIVADLPLAVHDFADAPKALAALTEDERIGKIVLTRPETVTEVVPEPLPHGRFRAEATYVITGGHGALGRSLAAYLLDHGAGAVALLSSGAHPAPEDPRIHGYRADVADRAALAEALAAIRADLPPIHGIVHAAGVLDDATVHSLRADRIERVLRPKIDGARHLHELTAEDPLDLFVLFSSAAALVGNPGQAAYAAANAYLDAFALARRHDGRPGLSVQWGPFDDIGLAAARADRGARLADRGLTGIAAGEAWHALRIFLAERIAVTGYLGFDRRRWFDAYPDCAGQASWSRLYDSGDGPAAAPPAAGGRLRTALAEASADERRTLIQAEVTALAARVLRLPATDLDTAAPLRALGLDSLLGLELRNQLETTFALRLSATLLWTYGTTAALATAIDERLAAEPA